MNLANMTHNGSSEVKNAIDSIVNLKRMKPAKVIVEELKSKGINAELCKRIYYDL
jgi:hypothetical protein